MAGEVVPFGKYKGQPVERLLDDQSYCEWVTSQPWLPDRWPAIFQIIVTRDPSLEETPEHNKLQAKFLEPWAREFVARRVIGDAFVGVTDHVEFEKDGWDVVFTAVRSHQFQQCVSKLGRYVKENDMLCRGCGLNERCNRHARLEKAIVWGKCLANICVEAKPTLGDDYPVVLRTVLARQNLGIRVVFVREFNASVSVEQVKKMFASRRIELVIAE